MLSLFLPVYNKNKLLLTQNILTASQQDGTLYVSQMVVRASKIVLKKTASCAFSGDQESLTNALQSTLAEFKGYDQFIYIHPSESILFKEIELPLTTKEQVSLVLEEEIEPHLPFTPQEGTTGFIINTTNPEGVSTVLTATIKNTVADALYAPFESTQIYPDTLTTEAECLAAFVSATHPLLEANAHFLRIIVDIQNTATQLIFVLDGKVRTTKTIPLGFSSFATTIKSEDETKPAQQHVDEQKYTELLNKILFAADALALKFSQSTAEQTLFFMQTYPPVDFKKILTPHTDRTIEIFSAEAASNTNFFEGTPKDGFDWINFSKHLGNGILAQHEEKITLPAAITEHNTIKNIKKGITAACIILTMIAGSIFLLGYRQISTLRAVLNAAESTQLSKLNEKFAPQISTLNKPSLKRAITFIEDHVREQQIFWNMFGTKNLDALEILYALTELIDRRLFNVDVSRVTITLSDDDHTPRITLEGTFVSKTEAHYSDFGIFEKHLALSKRLMLTKETENNFADDAHGVKFTARFKLRDT